MLMSHAKTDEVRLERAAGDGDGQVLGAALLASRTPRVVNTETTGETLAKGNIPGKCMCARNLAPRAGSRPLSRRPRRIRVKKGI